MKYDVHAYVAVRAAARGIDADSQVDAIAKFVDDVEPGLAERFDRGDDQSYAEEISGYLVDEEGDDNYGRSRSYWADGVTPEVPGNTAAAASLSKPDKEPRYVHDFAMTFRVRSDTPEWEDLLPAEILSAVLARANELDEDTVSAVAEHLETVDLED